MKTANDADSGSPLLFYILKSCSEDTAIFLLEVTYICILYLCDAVIWMCLMYGYGYYVPLLGLCLMWVLLD